MPDPTTDREKAQAYLKLDRQHYDALLDRLIAQIKDKTPGFPQANEPALRDYFAVALGRGTVFSLVDFESIGQMSPKELKEAAQKLPDKLSPKSRKAFADAAARRNEIARWDQLFPNGSNEIYLPFSIANEKSVNGGIEAFIARHNEAAKVAYDAQNAEETLLIEQGKLDPIKRRAGKEINQRKIQRDPNDPAKLQTYNAAKDRWDPGPNLGKYLNECQEWALLEDWQIENGRKSDGTKTQETISANVEEFMAGNRLPADNYDVNSLMVVISRDPQKIGEMSSGQHWQSCMREGGINFHYVPYDIEAGSLVAYVVSKNDPDARYPLMRQMLKPYRNAATGETVLIPAKIYGGDLLGNSFTRSAFEETLNDFVRNHSSIGKSGTFVMDNRLYGDGQAGTISFNSTWSHEEIYDGLTRFYNSSLEEYATELKRRLDIVEAGEADPERKNYNSKSFNLTDADIDKAKKEAGYYRKKIEVLEDPTELSKAFFRELRKSSLGSLPMPKQILEVASSSRVSTYHHAMGLVFRDNNVEPLKEYLANRPFSEKLSTIYLAASTRGKMQSGAIVANAAADLWGDYIKELPTISERFAQVTNSHAFQTKVEPLLTIGANIVLDDLNNASLKDVENFYYGTVDSRPVQRIKDALFSNRFNFARANIAAHAMGSNDPATQQRANAAYLDYLEKAGAKYWRLRSDDPLLLLVVSPSSPNNTEIREKAFSLMTKTLGHGSSEARIDYASAIIQITRSNAAWLDADQQAIVERAKDVLLENPTKLFAESNSLTTLERLLDRPEAVAVQQRILDGAIDEIFGKDGNFLFRPRDYLKTNGQKQWHNITASLPLVYNTRIPTESNVSKAMKEIVHAYIETVGNNDPLERQRVLRIFEQDMQDYRNSASKIKAGSFSMEEALGKTLLNLVNTGTSTPTYIGPKLLNKLQNDISIPENIRKKFNSVANLYSANLSEPANNKLSSNEQRFIQEVTRIVEKIPSLSAITESVRTLQSVARADAAGISQPELAGDKSPVIDLQKQSSIRHFPGGFEIEKISNGQRIPAARENFFSDNYTVHATADLDNLKDFFAQANKRADSYDRIALKKWLKDANINVDVEIYAATHAFTETLQHQFSATPNANRTAEREQLFYRAVEESGGDVKLSTLLKNNLAQCTEVSALAQVYLQQRGIHSAFVTGGMRDASELGTTPQTLTDHAFIVLGTGNDKMIFDANNPLLNQDGAKLPSLLHPQAQNADVTKSPLIAKDMTSGKQVVFGPQPKKGITLGDVAGYKPIMDYNEAPLQQSGNRNIPTDAAGRGGWVKSSNSLQFANETEGINPATRDPRYGQRPTKMQPQTVGEGIALVGVPKKSIAEVTVPVLVDHAVAATPKINAPIVDANGFTKIEVLDSRLGNGSAQIPEGMTITTKDGQVVTNKPAISNTAANEAHTRIMPTSSGARLMNIQVHGSGMFGLVMGGVGLSSKLSENSLFSQDIKAGGARETYAKGSITSDVAGVSFGLASCAASAKQASLVTKANSVALNEFEALATASKIASFGKYAKRFGIAGQAAGLLASGFEVAASMEAGDGHRAARATGGAIGGTAAAVAAPEIIATCTAAGTVVPGVGNALGFCVGLVVSGLAIWGASEAGAAAGDAIAGDDWQGHYDDKTKAKIASIQATIKRTGEKIDAAQKQADAYETALTNLDAAFKGKDSKALQAAYVQYQQALTGMESIQPISKAEKDDYLAAKHEIEKQLGYQMQRSVKNEALTNQLSTLAAAMDNSWLQINAMDFNGIISSSNNWQFANSVSKNTHDMETKLAKLVPQRVNELDKITAAEKHDATATKLTGALKEKNQPKIVALVQLNEINGQLQKKIDDNSVTQQDIDDVRAYISTLSPKLKKELSAVYTYEAGLLDLQKTHSVALKDAHYKGFDKKQPLPITAVLAQVETLKEALKKGVPPVLLETLAKAEQMVACQQPGANPPNNEALLNQLIDQNAALANPAIHAQLKQAAAQIVVYYTQGLDENGKAIANADPKLRDGIVDDQELQTILAQMNTKFKEHGITPASSGATNTATAANSIVKMR